MRTVQDILNSKKRSFSVIAPDVLVYDALNLLSSVNMSYVVVMENEEYKGIFSERDYSRNVILKGRASKSTPVGEVMTTDLPIVHVNETAEHCMHLMMSHGVRYLLAFEGNRFRGVITIHDLLRVVIRDRGEIFDPVIAEKLLSHDEGGGGVLG